MLNASAAYSVSSPQAFFETKGIKGHSHLKIHGMLFCFKHWKVPLKDMKVLFCGSQGHDLTMRDHKLSRGTQPCAVFVTELFLFQVLFDWMMKIGYRTSLYSLSTSFPRRPLEVEGGWSLQDIGITVDTVLNVEEKEQSSQLRNANQLFYMKSVTP